MGSSRFPGKPLTKILGMPMIEHVYKRSVLSGHETFVATCDEEIYNVVTNFGGKAIMTDPDITRPGLRVAQACETLGLNDDDIVIVVQGDEPFVHPEMIEDAIKPLVGKTWAFCTHLMNEATQEELEDTNEVKVVINNESYAMYFSRSPIPSNVRTDDIPRWKQVCVFAFKYERFKYYCNMKPTPLDLAESIEMLRIVSNRFKVEMIPTSHKTKSIDTKEDLIIAEKMMKEDELHKQYME